MKFTGMDSVQLRYWYEARKPGVKEQIIDMAHNGSGVRDSTRALKIGINTVIHALKTLTLRITSSPEFTADVALICEIDEQFEMIDPQRVN